MSLLRCSMADPRTAIKVLQMTQAQHVTAGDVCMLLATAIQASSPQRYGEPRRREDGTELMHVLLQ